MSEVEALGVVIAVALSVLAIGRLFVAVAVKRERHYRGGYLVTRWRLFGVLTVRTRRDLL